MVATTATGQHVRIRCATTTVEAKLSSMTAASDHRKSELMFVYNASRSPVAQALDFLHKTFSPQTYACNLCRVTYGVFTARKEWTEFIKGLPYPSVFLHRDEFERLHPTLAGVMLPAVFTSKPSGVPSLLVGAEAINQVDTVEEMKALLRFKLGGL